MRKVVIKNCLICTLLAVSLGFLLFVNLDFLGSRITDEICEFGHLPLFGVTALVFLRLFSSGSRAGAEPGHYVFSFLAAVLTGIATELLQGLTPGRFFEIMDILYDTLGAFTFLALAYPLKERSAGEAHQTGLSPRPCPSATCFTGARGKRITSRDSGNEPGMKHPAASPFTPALSRKGRRGIVRLKRICAGIIFAATIPLQCVVVDTGRMNREFPVLGSFENRLEMMRWTSASTAFKRVRSHAGNGGFALEVSLAPGEFPGVSLVHMRNDWNGYDRLVFDAYLEGDKALPAVVRIHDRDHDQTYADRFNKKIILAPGANVVSIDLDEAAKAPRGRVMDMSRIVNVCVFSYRLKEARTVYLDNFRLSERITGSGG